MDNFDASPSESPLTVRDVLIEPPRGGVPGYFAAPSSDAAGAGGATAADARVAPPDVQGGSAASLAVAPPPDPAPQQPTAATAA